MLMDLSKNELISLISTIEIDNADICSNLESEDLMVFKRDRPYFRWEWNKVKLEEFNEYQLKLLYIKYSNAER